MSSELEHKIIKKAISGNQKAFEFLILKYEKIVYNICYRYFHSEEDAKDVAQDVFIKVYRKLESFNFSSSFSTWLYRITCNTCIDEIRKQKRHQVLSLDDEENSLNIHIPDNSISPENSIIEKESYFEIETAIGQLDENHRTIIILREINEFSYDEIAKITDTSVGTVKSRLFRARNALAKLLSHKREQNKNENV